MTNLIQNARIQALYFRFRFLNETYVIIWYSNLSWFNCIVSGLIHVSLTRQIWWIRETSIDVGGRVRRNHIYCGLLSMGSTWNICLGFLMDGLFFHSFSHSVLKLRPTWKVGDQCKKSELSMSPFISVVSSYVLVVLIELPQAEKCPALTYNLSIKAHSPMPCT